MDDNEGNEAGEEMRPLYEAAVHLHVMFEELLEAGFTEQQALHLVSAMLVQSVVE